MQQPKARSWLLRRAPVQRWTGCSRPMAGSLTNTADACFHWTDCSSALPLPACLGARRASLAVAVTAAWGASSELLEGSASCSGSSDSQCVYGRLGFGSPETASHHGSVAW